MKLLNAIEDFFRDLRYSARRLRDSPGFTSVIVLTLGLGIGANTAVFSVVHLVLFEPLPYESPNRVVRIYEDHELLGFHDFAVAPGTLLSWRERARAFEGISFFVSTTRNLADDKAPEVLQGAAVSNDFFS